MMRNRLSSQEKLSTRQWLPFLAVLLLVASHFSLAYLSETEQFLSPVEYAAGKARQPFQERALMAWLFRGANHFDSPHFEAVLHHLLPAMGAWFNETSLVLLVVVWLSMVGSILFTRATLIKLTGDALFSSWAAFLVAYMAYFTYILNFGLHFQLPYDLPSLFFFCAGLYLLVTNHILLMFPLIAVATLNRETSLFLVLFYVVFAWSRRSDLWGQRAILGRAAAMVAVWVAMRLIVVHLYGHNPIDGATRFAAVKPLQNLRFLLEPQQWPGLASTFGFTLPVVIGGRSYLAPGFLRRGLLVVALWFLLMLFVGVIIEIRVFGELISYVSVALGVIVYRRIKARETAPVSV